MDEVFALLETLLAPALPALGRLNLGYADAFVAAFGIDPHRLGDSGTRELRRGLASRGIDAHADMAANDLLDLALVTVVLPGWPRGTAVFLHDYPVAQAALARIRPGTIPVAARFEVFVNGIELGNGFHELGDAAEQRARFESDLARRRELGLPEPPLDENLLAALRTGLPDCAGIAIGIDRLIAVLSGADSLTGVMNLVSDT
jgi:lysyl-tRNA synthetase class 2